MCLNPSDWNLPSSSRRRPKRSKVRARLTGRLKIGEERDMEMELENLRLYLENQLMIEENEKLRKKVLLLDGENQALLSELGKKIIF